MMFVVVLASFLTKQQYKIYDSSIIIHDTVFTRAKKYKNENPFSTLQTYGTQCKNENTFQSNLLLGWIARLIDASQ